MFDLASANASAYSASLNTASLPRYNTNIVADLPPDAAPQGILADGSVYTKPYELLTSDDVTFLRTVTGQSFDKQTVAAEEAAGTFTGNGLAAAIGNDRARGFLTSSVDYGYVDYLNSQINSPKSDGTFDGFYVTKEEVASAYSDLAESSNPSVELSA